MKYLKRSLYIFMAYIVFDLFFLTIVLPNPGRDKIHYIISAVATYIMWSNLYSHSWRCGRKDIRTVETNLKHDEGFTGSFKMYYGALTALPFTIVNVILAILAYNSSSVFDVIFKLFNYCCWSFLSDKNGEYIHAGVVFALVMPLLVYTTGYMVGKTGFSISDTFLPKIIYKKKK